MVHVARAAPCVEPKGRENALDRPPFVQHHLLQPRHQGNRVSAAHLRLPLALDALFVFPETVAQGQSVQPPLTR